MKNEIKDYAASAAVIALGLPALTSWFLFAPTFRLFSSAGYRVVKRLLPDHRLANKNVWRSEFVWESFGVKAMVTE